jgi:hypothetical protein
LKAEIGKKYEAVYIYFFYFLYNGSEIGRKEWRRSATAATDAES